MVDVCLDNNKEQVWVRQNQGLEADYGKSLIERKKAVNGRKHRRQQNKLNTKKTETNNRR